MKSRSVYFSCSLCGRVVQINEVKAETRDCERTLEEREMDPTLNYARHQISLSKERKLELYDILQDLHSELSSLLQQKGERKRQLSLAISKLNEGRNTSQSDLLVSESDYSRYITAFKEKAAMYKSKKGELQFLQSEIGRLATTKFLLDGEYQESCRSLVKKKLYWPLGLTEYDNCNFPAGQINVCNTVHIQSQSVRVYIYEFLSGLIVSWKSCQRVYKKVLYFAQKLSSFIQFAFVFITNSKPWNVKWALWASLECRKN